MHHRSLRALMSRVGRVLALAVLFTGLAPVPAWATQPTLQSTSPAPNSTVQSPASISATYDIALSNLASTMTVTDVSGTGVAGLTTLSNGNRTITLTPLIPLTEGLSPYTVRVGAQDSGSTDTTFSTWTFNVDTTAPDPPTVVFFTNPINNSNKVVVLVTGTAEANSQVNVTITDDVSAVVATTTAISGVFQVTMGVTSLLDGVLTTFARARDAAGNNSNASSPVTATYDSVNPVLVSTTPADGSSVQSIPTVEAAFAEALSTGISSLVLTNVIGNGVAGTTTFTSANRTIVFTPSSALSDAASPFRATATVFDPAGNTTAVSWTFTKDSVSPNAPVISFITDPINDTNKTTVLVTGTAETNSRVTVTVTGSSGSVESTVTATSGVFSTTVSTAALSDGIVTATAISRDAAGNVSAVSAPRTATKDTGVPASPTILFLTDPINNVNQTAIQVTGTAEAGVSVEATVTDGTNSISASSVATGGNFTINLNASTLNDGLVTATAVANDAAGNVSPSSSSVGATKDSVVPVLQSTTPANGALVQSAPTAKAAYQKALNTSTSTITVTDAGGSGVAGTRSFENSNKTIVFTPTVTFPDGVYTATATAIDTANNQVTSAWSFTVDATAPAAPSLGSFTNPINLSNRTTVIVTGTAEASSGVTVSVTDGSVTITASATATGGGFTVTLNVTSLSDGTVTATARATDAAGNTSAVSNALTSTKDTVAPALQSTSPANGSSVSSAPAASAAYQEVLDTGQSSIVVTDVTGTALSGTISFANSTKTVVFTPATSFDDAGSPFHATATVKDVAGNATTSNWTFSVDTSAPSAPVVVFMTNPINSTNKTAVSVTGTTESGSTVTVTITDGSVSVSTMVPASGTQFSASLNTSILADGVVTATAIAADSVGNTSPSSSPVTSTKDTNAPAAPTVVFITDPINAANKTTVNVTGTTESGASVTVTLTDGSVTITAIGSGPTFSVTMNVTTMADGSVTATAKAVDAVGNISALSAPKTATKDTVAPGTPVISFFTNPINDANKANVSVTGTAAAGTTVTVTVTDGTTTVTATGSGQTYAVNVDTTTLTDGVVTATASAADTAGNISSAASKTSVKDVLGPTLQSVSPLDGSTTGPVSSVRATYNEALSGSSTVVVLDRTGTQVSGSISFADVSKTVVFTPSPALSDAGSPYVATATVLDAAGNPTSSSSWSFTQDSSPPSAPTLAFLTDPISSANQDSVLVTGTSESGVTVTVRVTDGSVTVTAGVASAGTFSVTLGVSSLSDGVVTATAVASDTLGNTSGSSSARTASKDATAPTAPTPNMTNPINASNVSAVHVTGSAEAGSTVTVTITDGSVTLTATTTSTSFDLTFDATTLADGIVTATTRAEDAAGNVSGNSAPVTSTKDTFAPSAPVVVFMTNPINQDNKTAVHVTGTAETGAQVAITVTDGSVTVTATVTAAGGAFDGILDVSTLSEGTVTATAIAVDSAGNSSPISAPKTATLTLNPDCQPPSPNSFFAFPSSFSGGVYVAVGDVDGDGCSEIAVGQGAGGTPRVRLFNGRTNAIITELMAYNPAFTGGVRVAIGDLDGDGRSELITGAGPGGGPHVKAFTFDLGSRSFTTAASRFAYAPDFHGGVFVAAGDLDGDGSLEVITGADAGGGPHVKTFQLIGGSLSDLPGGFFAYLSTFRGGVRVAAGDVDGDGNAEIVTAPGEGMDARIRVFSYDPATGSRSLDTDFNAYGAFGGGAFVAAGDIDGSSVAEIVTGADSGGGPHVKGFTGTGSPVAGRSFFAYSSAFTGGVRVAVGDVHGTGVSQIVTGAGPGGGPHVRLFI